VCDVTTGEVITIKEDAFDESKHSKDTEVAACTEETPVETPAELPKTGANGALVALGLSALTTGIAYAVTGRKTLLG
jgi:LPXTG-motif cell wall-anchored protein